MTILVTGAAGFIGFHVTKKLLDLGNQVIGVDNISPYYDVSLKKNRVSYLKNNSNFLFYQIDIIQKEELHKLLIQYKISKVVHLAAQPGVRFSIKNPSEYLNSNILGFGSVLEICRELNIDHLVYASSSSVYGNSTTLPYSTHQDVNKPISLYAATKKSNELMAHSYSHLFKIPTTGLRYFTAYGPWGRPDMSTWLFTDAILKGKPINVFGNGQMSRDFTYVEDIAEGTVLALMSPPESTTPYRVFNIGNNEPTNLLEFISLLESKLNKKANKIFLPMQPGDVESTYADISEIKSQLGFEPKTSLDLGLSKWVDWYKIYVRTN